MGVHKGRMDRLSSSWFWFQPDRFLYFLVYKAEGVALKATSCSASRLVTACESLKGSRAQSDASVCSRVPSACEQLDAQGQTLLCLPGFPKDIL